MWEVENFQIISKMGVQSIRKIENLPYHRKLFNCKIITYISLNVQSMRWWAPKFLQTKYSRTHVEEFLKEMNKFLLELLMKYWVSQKKWPDFTMPYLKKYWIWRLQIFYSNLTWVEIVYWKIWWDYLTQFKFSNVKNYLACKFRYYYGPENLLIFKYQQ